MCACASFLNPNTSFSQYGRRKSLISYVLIILVLCVVNFILRHSVSYRHIFFCLGRNVQFCSEIYGRKVVDLMNVNISLSFIDIDSSHRINLEMHDRAKLVWEMLMDKDDLKCLTDAQFNWAYVVEFTERCCTY